LELIQILLEKVGAQPIENYAMQDFYLPYETTDALVRKGLIKDLWNQTPMEEEPAVVPVVETEDGESIRYRYIRTFMARLIQSDDEIKGYYGEIKNKFFSYKKVKSRISKKCETFNFGRTKLAKLDIRGKKIDLYLALDPAEFADQAKFYNFKDVSDKKPDFPMLMKVNGPIKLKRALELIQILLEKVGAQPIENYEMQDFYLPYETTDALVERGLIEDLLSKISENETPMAESTVEIIEEPVVEPIVEEVVETVVEVAVEEAVEIVAEPMVETVEESMAEPTVEETVEPVAETAEEPVMEAVVETEETMEEATDEEPIAATEETVEEVADEEVEPLQEIAATEEPTLTKPNVAMVFGVACVFKPYYDGCEKDDVLKIPMAQQRFAALKERKQIKIFKTAEKKREKEQAKQKKMEQRLLKKQEKELKKQKNDK
jgi:hypothetical protein